jgi:hypothetical protein
MEGTVTTEVVGEGELLLTRGGPLFTVQQRLHLAPPAAKALGVRFPIAAIALTWVPLVLMALPERLQTGQWEPLLHRNEVHIRLLGSLLLILYGEGVLEQRVQAAMRGLSAGQVLSSDGALVLRQRVDRLLQVRSARLPEFLLLTCVYAASLAAFLGILPPWALRWMAPTVHQAGLHFAHATPAWWWYLLVSQPLFLFVFLRWLFHWCLWGSLLGKLAKLQPRINAGHGDRAGGLGFLAGPLFGMRFFVAGTAFAIAAVWLDEIARSKADPAIFTNDFVVFVLLSLLAALLPYVPFTRLLVEARHEGELNYSLLMRRYAERFEGQWLRPQPQATGLLGTPDIQSLADLEASFAMVKDMRPLIPGAEEIKTHLVASAAPFLIIPLIYGKSTTDLIQKLLLKVVGG